MDAAEGTSFWLISTPSTRDDWNQLNMATMKDDLSENSKFAVPSKEFKVGTLDTLMALSDDLIKSDVFGEATAFKIYRQLMELQKDAGAIEEPTIPVGDNGRPVSVEHYLTRFAWDEAKYPVKSPLRELTEQLNAALTRMDDELKAKATEYNNARSAKQAIERKETGNLMVRSLNELVKKEDFIESEHLTTLLVVVPKFALKDWAANYATLGGSPSFVVPGSSRTVFEDADSVLVTVTLFRSIVEDFKHAAREKRFTVRDYSFSEEGMAADKDGKAKAIAEHDKSKAMFLRWCKTNFAEAYSAMVHLKAVRLFVESVLRYGVPPTFEAVLLKPKPRKEMALRRTLDQRYGHLASNDMIGGDDAEMPGQQAEFYPYVYLTVNTAPPAI